MNLTLPDITKLGYDIPGLQAQYNAPRNKREALQRIVDTYECQGKFVIESYYKRGATCAVGSLFTPAQLLDIATQDGLDDSVPTLAKKIGVTNIEFMAGGLTIRELESIQALSDRGPLHQSELVSAIKTALFLGAKKFTIGKYSMHERVLTLED